MYPIRWSDCALGFCGGGAEGRHVLCGQQRPSWRQALAVVPRLVQCASHTHTHTYALARVLTGRTRLRDNIKAPESFIGTADAVSAIHSLEREIAAIDERFERGELNSFGQSEEVVLQRFQELRRRQVDLSRRQVELLSKKAKTRFGAEQSTPQCTCSCGSLSHLYTRAAGGLEQLTADMQKLCSMIEQVELLTQPERGPPKVRTTTTTTNARS